MILKYSILILFFGNTTLIISNFFRAVKRLTIRYFYLHLAFRVSIIDLF